MDDLGYAKQEAIAQIDAATAAQDARLAAHWPTIDAIFAPAA
jgi:hypothetical protein